MSTPARRLEPARPRLGFLGPLVTHRFPLDRLGDAFAAMQARPDGFLKGIVAP